MGSERASYAAGERTWYQSRWEKRRYTRPLLWWRSCIVNGNLQVLRLIYSRGRSDENQASRPNPPKAILDLFGFKYLRDPFYHTGTSTQPQPGAPALPSVEFINKVFSDIPPPTAARPPFGPNGLDLSTPRQAYLIASVRKGTQFDAIIAEDEYDRVDPEKLLNSPDFPPTCFVQGTADVVVDAKFSQWAYAELQKNRVRSELYLVEGMAHGFDARLKRGDAAFVSIQKGVDFLAEHVVG